MGLGGVWGAARGQGDARNTRDPSVRPESGQARPYKPKAKSGRAQRESEGIVVPVIAVKNNAAGGKGPGGGCVAGAGKREGMAAKSGPNDSGGREPRAEVRQLQRRLWAAAKRSPGRRFHALYDHIHRSDVLWEAWKRVRAKKGAAGVDAETIADIEREGQKVPHPQTETARRDLPRPTVDCQLPCPVPWHADHGTTFPDASTM
jgi:hypothetical protein